MSRRTKNIMLQGSMSGVGKSILTAALCRIFLQDGLRVAPFKSQNMALNSFVTPDGGEIGRAQAMQAVAAGKEPDVRMNPILLKPTSDSGSEVVVLGEARAQMRAAEYFQYKRKLIPELIAAYDGLAGENDVVVIEGAGSPAEINLRENDIVNMGLAELVDAPVLLVGDIDRGGVFAQLYGTIALLSEKERARVGGLVVNKFRGDIALLKPGLDALETLTGKPVTGVVPYIHAELDDEDSLAPFLLRRERERLLDVAVIRLPHISNFTDFAPLSAHPALGVRFVDTVRALGAPDLLILPGTKSATGDLMWLKESGLAERICALAAAGTPVLGVCGGYQMLGETLSDPERREGDATEVQGLGLLPVRTCYTGKKLRERRSATVLSPFAGAAIEGYEIHAGRSESDGPPFCRLSDGQDEGCVSGNVFGTYLHGLFDTGALTVRLAEYLAKRRGIALGEVEMPPDRRRFREEQLDLLADGVRRALDMDAVRRIMGL